MTPISTFYERLVQKRGGSKAKVAAAAKMVRIVFWMLKKDIGFWACVEEGRKSMDQNGKTKTAKKKRVKNYGQGIVRNVYGNRCPKN